MASSYLVSSRYTRIYDVRLAVALDSSTAAAMLQQLHYHLDWKEREDFEKVDGRLWWRSSMAEWRREFPDVSERTIRREIKLLYDAGLIVIRRENTAAGSSVWYSIDYAKVEEVGKKGEAPVQIGRTPSRNLDAPPSRKLDGPPSQIDSHLIDPSEKQDSEKSPPPSATAPGRGGKKTKSLEELQENVRQNNLQKLRERFARTESVHSVERLWEMLVVEHFGRANFTPLSVVDRQNTKKYFVSWCVAADVKLLDLLEYCVSNWEALRDHKMKALKLSDYPSFRSIYALKDRFLEQMRKNGHGKGETHGKLISRVDQIPKGHPSYDTLKRLVEKGETVTLS